MNTNRIFLAKLLVSAAAVASLLLLVVGGAVKPGYSHVANFISELNATGTPLAETIGLFGFLPLGILVASFLIVAAPVARVDGWSRVGYWLLFSQPIAYIGVFLFPCDLGCPLQGSQSQQLHNLVALVTYIACAVAFLLLSRSRSLASSALGKAWFVGTGIVWLVGFFAMVEPGLAPWRGLLQRVLEVSLYMSLFVVAWRMLSTEDSSRSQR